MTVLGNTACGEALANGTLVITPVPPQEHIGTSSIDLTLGDEFKRWKEPSPGIEQTIDPAHDGFSFTSIAESYLEEVPRDEDGSVVLKPQGFLLARTAERVNLPLESGLAARVEGRSSLARCGLGIHVTAPTIHTGFRGTIALEIANHGTLPMRLRPNLRICQLIVEQVVGSIEGDLKTSFQGQETVSGAPR